MSMLTNLLCAIFKLTPNKEVAIKIVDARQETNTKLLAKVRHEHRSVIEQITSLGEALEIDNSNTPTKARQGIYADILERIADNPSTADWTASRYIDEISWLTHNHRIALREQIDLDKYRQQFSPEIIDENRRQAIRMLRRVEALSPFALNMCSWQNSLSDYEAVPYMGSDGADEVHKCGNTACFAGYIRVDPYFNSIVDFVKHYSAPCVAIEGRELKHSQTVAGILGVPDWFANVMIYNLKSDQVSRVVDGDTFHMNAHYLYRCHWGQVKPQDIIDVLEKLLLGVSPTDIFNEAQASEVRWAE